MNKSIILFLFLFVPCNVAAQRFYDLSIERQRIIACPLVNNMPLVDFESGNGVPPLVDSLFAVERGDSVIAFVYKFNRDIDDYIKSVLGKNYRACVQIHVAFRNHSTDFYVLPFAKSIYNISTWPIRNSISWTDSNLKEFALDKHIEKYKHSMAIHVVILASNTKKPNSPYIFIMEFSDYID